MCVNARTQDMQPGSYTLMEVYLTDTHTHTVPAVQTVGQLFSVPHSRKRKKYLESLEAGMDLSPAPGAQVTRYNLIATDHKSQNLWYPHLTSRGPPMSSKCKLSTTYRNSYRHGDVQKHMPASKRKRQPYPPKHYVATVEARKTSDYNVPEMDAAGDIICPEGYAATRPGRPSASSAPGKVAAH